MNIKETIRAEIERLIADPTLCSTTERKIGGHTALLKLVDFLDTLPEQPVEDLEEAAERYAQFYDQDLSDENGNFVNGCGDLRAAFIAGAEWQKKLDDDGAAVRAAASNLVSAVERYVQPKPGDEHCLRSELLNTKDNLKALLK